MLGSFESRIIGKRGDVPRVDSAPKELAGNHTASGEYRLPGPFYCFAGNVLLRAVRWLPSRLRRHYVRGRRGYQTFSEAELVDQEGLSIKKWEALQMPADLSKKSVLDVGCSEGFFCRQAAKNGAGPVVGLDTGLGRLICASSIALEEGLNIRYRRAVFPRRLPRGKYDYVLCLSVLHHSLSTRDLWKVLALDEFAEDRLVLRRQLRVLRELTADGGKCVVEMPYEYDNPAEREEVDFERFNAELTGAGFSRARCLGSWDYNPKFKQMKDRIIYVADAG